MFKWIVKNIYGANLFGKLLIGHIVSTLYTILESYLVHSDYCKYLFAAKRKNRFYSLYSN